MVATPDARGPASGKYQEAGQLPDFPQGFELKWFLANFAGWEGRA
jgi:hypothetical protein